MQGHLEYFDDECYFVADDDWLPWTDIFLCKDGDFLYIMEGENAGEEVQITITDKKVQLIGNDFEMKDIDRVKVDFRRGV
jgi:hypothetical protein